MGRLKMRDMKMRDQIAGVETAERAGRAVLGDRRNLITDSRAQVNLGVTQQCNHTDSGNSAAPLQPARHAVQRRSQPSIGTLMLQPAADSFHFRRTEKVHYVLCQRHVTVT